MLFIFRLGSIMRPIADVQQTHHHGQWSIEGVQRDGRQSAWTAAAHRSVVRSCRPGKRPSAVRAALLLPTVLGLFAAPAARALDCSESAERELARLGIAGDEIGEVRYVEKINPTERGPDVLDRKSVV